MATDDRAPQQPTPKEENGRILGWLSGLGLLFVPWVSAGVLATGGGMLGPDSWDAERTFPWLLLATFVASLGWVTYGIVRIPGFRRGALPGTAIALIVMVVLSLLVLVALLWL